MLRGSSDLKRFGGRSCDGASALSPPSRGSGLADPSSPSG